MRLKPGKMVILSISLTFLFGCTFPDGGEKYQTKDCEQLKSDAEDAYSYFKKAYNSSSLDDVQNYSKKGMNFSSNAQEEATESNCDCDDAEDSAADAYSFGKKAYNADDIEEAQDYAKKAMSSASDVTEQAEDCENE